MAPGPDASTEDDQKPPADPAELLALIQRQQHHTEQRLSGGFTPIYPAFGAAWLLGYGLLFLSHAATPVWPIGPDLALSLHFGLIALAGACTAVILIRGGRGLRGGAQSAATMYGVSWMIGMIGISAVLGAAMPLGVGGQAAELLWSASTGLVAGLLLLSGGAVFGDVRCYLLGLWIVSVTAVGAFAGVPTHYLFMSFGGGGGLILFGALLLIRERRHGRAAEQRIGGRR